MIFDAMLPVQVVKALRPYASSICAMKWSLRSGPHRRVLIWVLHSAR